MKFALYLIASCQVVQWQDDELYPYNEPEPSYARIELVGSDVPPDFDVAAVPSGWWVVNDALTQTAPPPPIEDVALWLTWAARSRGYDRQLAGVPIGGNPGFAPMDNDFVRLGFVAAYASTLGLTSVDIKLGGGSVWTQYDVADLVTAFPAFVKLREECWTSERAHVIAINALLANNDRAGLEAYDVTTGWPA